MARRNRLSLDIDGLPGLIGQLAQFKSKSTAKRLMRGGMGKAAQALVQAARRETPTETGLLKKAMTKRVKSRGMGMTATVGADASKVGEGPDGRRRVPANYIHLVEYGHLDADTGRAIPGARMIEKTREREAPKVAEVFVEDVGRRVVKELAKGKSGRKR